MLTPTILIVNDDSIFSIELGEKFGIWVEIYISLRCNISYIGLDTIYVSEDVRIDYL